MSALLQELTATERAVVRRLSTDGFIALGNHGLRSTELALEEVVKIVIASYRAGVNDAEGER